MTKLLFLILLGVIAYLLYTRAQAGRVRNFPHKQTSATSKTEQMVVCAHCGVYLPQSDSLEAGGQHYCSLEHRQLGMKART